MSMQVLYYPTTILPLLLLLLTTTGASALLSRQQEGARPRAFGAGSHHQLADNTYYQPALIGFRCETVRDILPSGVSIIEANTPVTLTLYGESFTTNTIVAFTTEFRPDTELDPALSTHIVDETNAKQPPKVTTTTTTTTTTTLAPPTTTAETAANSSSSSSSSSRAAATAADATSTSGPQVTATTNTNYGAADSLSSSPLTAAAAATAPTNRRLFANRRRTRSKSYDCTDYNRVTSYRLTDDNILSPNVATLTISLPELDAISGLYYYFCLKQPPLTGIDPSSSASGGAADSANDSLLVWVHQGDEWWVTLKAEPPILSVANDCVLIILLLFLSAVTSGLNLGLMSLDMNELAVISSCGDQRERSYARIIAPLRKRGNYLLCSLLLGNVMVNATLTVILEEMTSGVVAVIGSTLAIVVLGEIVPQAFCARQGLAIGARTIYLTYAFMLITFPLSYPISCLLDYVLGEEKGNVYDRERLMEFIKITGHHTQLEADEVAIISGALKLKKIKVDQIMTRIEDVFMLPIDCQLDRETIKRIIEKGYSRIPVYEFGDRKQIVALILAKDLALLDPDDHTPIANMLMYCKHPLIFIEDDATLDVALNEFKTGKSHMAVVRQIYDDEELDKYYEAIGVVTLEDVIEEVLQVEINDETDTLSDNRRKRRRTEAQVSHLIDELTSPPSTVNASSRLGDCELGTSCASHHHEQALLSKQVQTSLSSHLTSVSIGSLTQSLGRQSRQQQQQQQQNRQLQLQLSPANGQSQAATPTQTQKGAAKPSASRPDRSSVVVAAMAEEAAHQQRTSGQAEDRLSQSQSQQLQQQQQQQDQDGDPQAGGMLGRVTQFLGSLMG